MRCETAALTPAEIGAIARRIDRPIALVGLMGAGKSTVGRKLAGLLQVDFIDADDAIEQAAAMTIPEMFERFGEPHFRGGERRVIARLIDERLETSAANEPPSRSARSCSAEVSCC